MSLGPNLYGDNRTNLSGEYVSIMRYLQDLLVPLTVITQKKQAKNNQDLSKSGQDHS